MDPKTDFEHILIKTEEKWLKILYREIRTEFTKHPLPSHDHTHHFRVWLFAKELLRALSDEGHHIDNTRAEKVIISAFFHDVGMTVTHQPSHGIESRLICERFFHQSGGSDLPDMNEIYEAIEMHDDKQYAQKRKGISTRTILAVADDLDAYGAIGIYRYYEIYMLRGMRKEEIPSSVIGNMNNRFSFMERAFGSLHAFIRKHRARKQLTTDFYQQFFLKDSTIDTPLLTHRMNYLDWLVERAYQSNNGLDFLLDTDTDLYAAKKDLLPLVNKLRKELRLFQFNN
jgi:HD superfamily phosphodiesterase